MYFFNDNDRIPIWISLEFVPRNPIDNKLLPEQMLAQLIKAYMGH